MDARSHALKPADRLLQTATRLFCRQGIKATGIDKILAEAGVAKMTLYNQFGSKEGLVFAVLEREGAAWRNWFADAVQRLAGSPADRLVGIFTVLDDWFRQENFYGCAILNAVAEHNKDDPRIRTLAAAHKRQIQGMLADLAQAAGCDAPEDVARMLSLLIDGAIIAAVTGNGSEAAQAAAAATRTLLASQTSRTQRANAA